MNRPLQSQLTPPRAQPPKGISPKQRRIDWSTWVVGLLVLTCLVPMLSQAGSKTISAVWCLMTLPWVWLHWRIFRSPSRSLLVKLISIFVWPPLSYLAAGCVFGALNLLGALGLVAGLKVAVPIYHLFKP